MKTCKILCSRVEKGRRIKSLPEMITISNAGLIWLLITRNTSRILRLARLRTTALPIFLEAIMPSLNLSRLLGIKKTVQKVPILFFWPSSKALLYWDRDLSTSLFLKVLPPIPQTVSLLRPLRLRFARILRPPGVALRWRNPCVLFLHTFFGWYVLFIVSYFSRWNRLK